MRGEGGTDDDGHVLVVGEGTSATDADVTPSLNVLGVTYGTAAEAWLEAFQDGVDRAAVVSVGEHSRTAAAASTDAGGAGPNLGATAVGVAETVPSVEDVAAVGTLVNDYVSAWEGETTVYVDDFAPLLDRVSAETAFRFAHVLASCTAANDGRVVAGLDTAERPPHVAATFAELFDDVRDR